MRKGGVEPPRVLPHYHLKVARIPIPPLPQAYKEMKPHNTLSIIMMSTQNGFFEEKLDFEV